jgi:hypothetical protein
MTFINCQILSILPLLIYSVASANFLEPTDSLVENQAKNGHDTLDIRYEIISQKYLPRHNIIKIKIPPYLSTQEVMEQIRLVLQWPGDPPPQKITIVYIFKETDQIGDSSQTGAIFIPGQGFTWKLNDWKPIEFPLVEPTLQEKIIYNTLLDSMFTQGITDHNLEIKKKIAQQFNISVSKLDSIYFKVKYWMYY